MTGEQTETDTDATLLAAIYAPGGTVTAEIRVFGTRAFEIQLRSEGLRGALKTVEQQVGVDLDRGGIPAYNAVTRSIVGSVRDAQAAPTGMDSGTAVAAGVGAFGLAVHHFTDRTGMRSALASYLRGAKLARVTFSTFEDGRSSIAVSSGEVRQDDMQRAADDADALNEEKRVEHLKSLN